MSSKFIAMSVGLGLTTLLAFSGCKGSEQSSPAKHGKAITSAKADTTVAAAPAAAESAKPLMNTTFESAASLPNGWKSEGDVTIANEGAFEGKHSLRLARKDTDLLKPVSVISEAFPVAQGNYEVQLSLKTDLVSPDNSYNTTVGVIYVEPGGKTVDGPQIATQDGKRNWTLVKKQFSIPASYSSARLKIYIDKAAGQTWIDAIAVRPVASMNADAVVNRLYFETSQMGNLLYPNDSRQVKITTWTVRPLSDAERNISCMVRDYFGAEQGKPLTATVKQTGIQGSLFVYEGSVDLSPVNLEVGRYYEVHGTIKKSDGNSYSNYKSFAILPEAPANKYKPDEIPFTARTWDARIGDAQYLNHRLGIRIGGIWGGFNAQPPYTPVAATIEDIQKLGMGYLTGTMAHSVEQRSPGWEKLTDEVLREGTRNFLKAYGNVRPVVFNLGNEPPNKGDDVKANVAAYKSIYEEIKKFDPNIIVVSTSCGPNEDFFKAGFGKYCDAYDFHVYGDSAEVRDIIENRYPALFAKYGDKKPIWSTELGLNSHGMARLPVATEVVKKLTNFFAAGGANCSWFGTMYPDPDAVIWGSGSEAHNYFDSRYVKYAPKLDAIAYYNMVNGILNKKFLDEKVYDDAIKGFLFRNDKGLALQVYYTDKGRFDVGVPLKGVENVEVVRIDGTRSELSAGGKGVTVTVSEDPILLLYQGGEAQLADALDKPVARVDKVAGPIVSGLSGTVDVTLTDAAVKDAKLKVPFGWTTKKSPALTKERPAQGASVWTFAVQSPAETNGREADIVVKLTDASGKLVGELYDRAPITGSITMNMLPVPAKGDKPSGVNVIVRNNGEKKEDIQWSVTLKGEKPVIDGVYDSDIVSAQAYFAGEPSGELTLKGGEAQTLFVPLANINPTTVYYARAVVKDRSGRQVVDDRNIAGFVPVPKVAKGSIKIDGDLNDAAWAKAKVLHIGSDNEYFDFRRKEGRRNEWTSPEDLSADIRYLWDEDNLYVSLDVKDDIKGGLKADGDGWAQDGLQFLIDPSRTTSRKVGKYDYSFALTSKGLQGWCYLSADTGAAPSGEVKDVNFTVKYTKPGTGDAIYELAIPWKRISPFKPAVNADLGLTVIVNEDDGKGRESYMTWFGNASSKDIDTVGDLILVGE